MQRTTPGQRMTLVVVLMLTSVLAGAAPAATESATAASTYSVLVMGDSYSAGVGAGNYDDGCLRSSGNYGHLLGAMIEDRYPTQQTVVETVACVGAVTEDFAKTQFRGQPPQLDAVHAGHDLILLTIGGNDLDFVEIAQQCLYVSRKASKCDKELSRAEAAVGPGGQLEVDVQEVLSGIAAKAHPDAQIVLLGYPRLEGDENYTLTEKKGRVVVEAGRRVRQVGAAGDALQARVVESLNASLDTDQFLFVPVAELFRGHELYAERLNPQRWMVDPREEIGLGARLDKSIYHPNWTGYFKEAQLLFADPRIDFRDIHVRPPGSMQLRAWSGSLTINQAADRGLFVFTFEVEGGDVLTSYHDFQTGGPVRSAVNFVCSDPATGSVLGGGGSAFFAEQLVYAAGSLRTYRVEMPTSGGWYGECRLISLSLVAQDGSEQHFPDEEALAAAGFGVSFPIVEE